MSDLPKILVVDDHDDLRWIRSTSLREEGFEVVEAEDGIAALTLLACGLKPQLILSDLDMPRCDGFRFMARLRREPAWIGIPVLLVSSDPRLPDIADATCAAGYIDKCASSTEYTRVVRSIMALRNVRPEKFGSLNTY